MEELHKELTAAKAAGNKDNVAEVQDALDTTMIEMQVMMVSVLEDSCKVLYSLYGDPKNIAGFTIPEYHEPTDFAQLLAMTLPLSKWKDVTNNLLDERILRAAKASLHPDRRWTLIDAQGQTDLR